MSGKLALFYKEKEYFLTSNMRSSFQISPKRAGERRWEGGREREEGNRGRGAAGWGREGRRETKRPCMSRSKK